MNLEIQCLNITDIVIRRNCLITTDSFGNKKEYNISKMTYLDCSNNHLTSLPNLPERLNHLYCFENQLVALPILPKGLETLDCSGNRLSSLPKLPEGLESLRCHSNDLIYVQYLIKKPFAYIVPSNLKEKHADEAYQRNYVLQTCSRHFISFLVQKSKYYKTFRVFDSVLSESLL